MAVSYVGFGNDKLEKLPGVKAGDKIECLNCGGEHSLEAGTVDGKPDAEEIVLFYKCATKLYLGAVAGRLVANVKACCSGKI